MSLRRLVVGNVEGQFDVVFERVQNVMKSNGEFDLLLCVGRFLSKDVNYNTTKLFEYITKQKQVPLPTYFIGDHTYCDLLQKSSKTICKNLHYLGRQGLVTLEGLKIFFSTPKEELELTGYAKSLQQPEDDEELKNPAFPANGIDLFITWEWPAGILSTQTTTDKNDYNLREHSADIAKLVMKANPRYIFGPSPTYSTKESQSPSIYFEAQPYRNNLGFASRFIAIANVGNPSKQKWMYAANIVPLADLDQKTLFESTPNNIVDCPFANLNTKELDETTSTSRPNNKSNQRNKHHQASRRNRQAKTHQERHCWFCLGAPNVETHLVVSVGFHFYVALAKGGIVPDHFLIVPITHVTSSLELSADTAKELKEIKERLKHLFKREGKSIIFFERNLPAKFSGHMHIQGIPISNALGSQVTQRFEESGSELNISFYTCSPEQTIQDAQTNPYFFSVEIDGTQMIHFPSTESSGVPLQFGREVIANLLGTPDKADWKEAALSKDEEIQNAERFLAFYQAGTQQQTS